MAGRDSIVLLLPFFGRLPEIAPMFFRSCAENSTIDWLLMTDQAIDAGDLPSNVRVKRTTLQAFKRAADAALGFDTALTSPYKLCDFKPAYGVICAEDVDGYDFWGHCDMDMIFGDVRRFLTPEILSQYKKVLIHGHLSLYRNCDEANNYFRLETDGLGYRSAFTSGKSLAFDEFGGMRVLLRSHRIPFFRDDSYLADIDRNKSRFTTIQGPNHKHQCFYWERGRVFKAFWDGDALGRQEYMYIHLQKRVIPERSARIAQREAWYITPRGFVARESEISGTAELDRLNPRDVLFDGRRQIAVWLWQLRQMLSRHSQSRVWG
jgi:hypothetical protein